MPEELNGQLAQTAPQPSPQPAITSPAPSSAPDLGQGTQPSSSATQQQQGFLDTLRAAGVDANFANEQQALQYLTGLHRQAPELRQLATAGQLYLQHQGEFSEWMRLRQQQQAQQGQQQQSWWKAPEYDPRWTSQVYRDPHTGALRVQEGADPAIAMKLLAWHEHQRGFLERFSQDPLKAIEPGLKQMIAQEAQTLIAQQTQAYQQQTAARQIVEQHSGWLYEQGQNGQPLHDPQTGQPVLNFWGQRYAQHVVNLERQGVTNVQAMNDLALSLVRGEYAQYRSQQAAAPAQPQQPALPTGQPSNPANEAFLAAHRPNVAQPTAPLNGSPSPQQTQASPRGLAEMLMRNLNANGYRQGESVQGR